MEISHDEGRAPDNWRSVGVSEVFSRNSRDAAAINSTCADNRNISEFFPAQKRRHAKTGTQNSDKIRGIFASGSKSSGGARSFFNPRERYSIGIACVKFIDNRPHLLMVSKRYTYAFSDFVKGKYDKSDPKKNKNSRDCLIALFDKMTAGEKLTILSMDFSYMWYKIWLTSNKKGIYYKFKSIFETMFLTDGGARLRWLISKSRNHNLIWEIPKGKKICNNEPDIYCAIREFQEETGISKKSYHIYPRIRMSIAHNDQGITYHSTYYLAITARNIEPKIKFSNEEQISEISDIRWMNIDNIRLIDENKNLEQLARRIFKVAKKMNKFRA